MFISRTESFLHQNAIFANLQPSWGLTRKYKPGSNAMTPKIHIGEIPCEEFAAASFRDLVQVHQSHEQHGHNAKQYSRDGQIAQPHHMKILQKQTFSRHPGIDRYRKASFVSSLTLRSAAKLISFISKHSKRCNTSCIMITYLNMEGGYSNVIFFYRWPYRPL